MQERRVLCLLAFLSPSSLFPISKLETGIRRGALFFTFLGDKRVLWFGRFCVVLFFFFSPLLLLLPCPFCLPAASLRVAAALTQSVQKEEDQGGHLGLGPRCPSPLGGRGRSPGCSLSALSHGFQADQSPHDHCSLTLRETGLERSG